MGYDSLTIVSMNSSRKGLHNMAPCDRSSYLQQLLSNARPDICLLPGDNNEKDNAVAGYYPYMVPGNNETVLLYDHKRVTMHKQNVPINTSDLPGMDMRQIVCPYVEVKAPAPMDTVVKSFSLMTWHYELPSTSRIRQEDLMRSIVIYAQRVSMATGAPIIIGGEMNAATANLEGIIAELNAQAQQSFLEGVQPGMAQVGYTPQISKTALTSERNKFKLVLCKPNPTVKRHNSSFSEPVPDCFIASKSLELSKGTFLDVEEVFGRKVEMKALKEHCPTRTEIRIPERPPRHSGG